VVKGAPFPGVVGDGEEVTVNRSNSTGSICCGFLSTGVAQRSEVGVLGGISVLFVCLFMCLFVNTITSQRLNVGR